MDGAPVAVALPAHKKTTRTIAGLCPNRGQAKPDGAVPGWIEPEARIVKPGFAADVSRGIGPDVGGALLAGALVPADHGVVIAEALEAIAVTAAVRARRARDRRHGHVIHELRGRVRIRPVGARHAQDPSPSFRPAGGAAGSYVYER